MQKDIQANVSALNEVISSTTKFLEENRSKLTPEQVAAIELKLEEVKSKANMLNQRAEETRKELEKVVTTVIKQETEKVGQFLLLLLFTLIILACCKYFVKKNVYICVQVAAVEQLEETKNKIEVLLEWVSNIGKEKEMGGMAKENGNLPVEGKLTGREDDPNGNALDTTDNTSQWSGEDTKELDIDQQYEKLKVSRSLRNHVSVSSNSERFREITVKHLRTGSPPRDPLPAARPNHCHAVGPGSAGQAGRCSLSK